MTGEEIYDQQIAPLLLQVAKLCEQHGMAMVATVEFAPNNRGCTHTLPADAGLAMKMAYLLTKTGVNVDGYIINLVRMCRELGVDTSGSIVLQRMEKVS